jgi:hypothetical protein
MRKRRDKMPRRVICQYGNCTTQDTPIVLTFPQDHPSGHSARKYFCSYAHLALWITRHASPTERREIADDIATNMNQFGQPPGAQSNPEVQAGQ